MNSTLTGKRGRAHRHRHRHPTQYTCVPAIATGTPERWVGGSARRLGCRATTQQASPATDHLKGAADRAQEMAGDVSQQARVYGEKAQDAARQVKPFAEKSLKEQPMTTLAAVAAIGSVLGALWKK